MTSVNTDRDVTWSTKLAPRKINGILYKKGASGLFLHEFGADNMVESWHNRGYRARKELVFLHEKGDKKYKHPNPNYGMQWTTPGKAAWIVWRSVAKAPSKR